MKAQTRVIQSFVTKLKVNCPTVEKIDKMHRKQILVHCVFRLHRFRITLMYEIICTQPTTLNLNGIRSDPRNFQVLHAKFDVESFADLCRDEKMSSKVNKTKKNKKKRVRRTVSTQINTDALIEKIFALRHYVEVHTPEHNL